MITLSINPNGHLYSLFELLKFGNHPAMLKFLLLMFTYMCTVQVSASCVDYKSIPLSHSKNLLLSKKSPNEWLVEIRRPWQKKSDQYQVGPIENRTCTAKWIKWPVDRFALSSTTSVAYLDLLGRVDAVVAYPNVNYVSNKEFKKRYESKLITELNYPPSLEKIIALKPDLFLSFAATLEDVGNLNRLWSFKIPVIFEADFMEKDPLGRAEWIKFYGLLLGKYEESEKIFATIEKRYDELTKIVEKKIPSSMRKKILLGRTYGNSWQAPSGSSDFALMLKLAGGDYIFSDRQNRNVMNILSFEEVLTHLNRVSVWIPLYGHKNRADLKLDDHRLGLALQKKEITIFDISKGLNGNGGNDYWETAMVRPDLLLEELISILYPELLKHESRWFLELK